MFDLNWKYVLLFHCCYSREPPVGYRQAKLRQNETYRAPKRIIQEGGYMDATVQYPAWTRIDHVLTHAGERGQSAKRNQIYDHLAR